MARFFFNTRGSRGTYLDEQGTEFPGVAEAHTVAITSAGELIRDLGMSLEEEDTHLELWVANAAGDTVCTIDFSTNRKTI